MNKNEIIYQLESLAEYVTDEIAVSDCDDIWEKNAKALADAIVAVKMLHDIFENLDGQDIKGEMVAILSGMGYEDEDFERLGICSVQEVEEYVDNYNN